MRTITATSIRRIDALTRRCPQTPAQRRWARVRDVRFVATQQASVGVTDRYREKLERKVKETGVQDVDQLKEVYKERITDLRKRAAVPGMNAPLSKSTVTNAPPATQPSSSTTQPQKQTSDWASKGSSTGAKIPGIKTLSSFLDVSKILELPQREIEALWRLRFAQNPASLCAAIPTKIWSAIYDTARKYPLFILPGLPKHTTAEIADSNETQEAAPIHLLQWTFPSPTTATVIFTHLAEYKLRGEYAQPHTTVTHHLDLAEPKSLVLSEGTVIDGRGVSVEEGKWLIMNMQKFYNTGDDVENLESSDVGRELKSRRRRLLKMFARGDENFKLDDLIAETERMG